METSADHLFSTACIVIAADGDQIYFLNSANGCHGTRQPYCALYCTNKDTGILIGIFSIPTVIYCMSIYSTSWLSPRLSIYSISVFIAVSSLNVTGCRILNVVPSFY